MAPPPVTPSPHRFVTTTKGPKAPSVGTQDLSQRQFALTPRFSSASLKKHASADASSLWPPQSSSSPLITKRIVQHPTLPTWKGEEIEEASSDAETHEASIFPDAFTHTAHKNVENSTVNVVDVFSPFPDPKRRRLISPIHHGAIPMSSDEVPSSSPPNTPPPPQQIHATHATLRRFVSAPAINSGPHSPSSLLTRPHFILPPSSPPTIIPPVFSPHRRGTKYIPGGLAASAFEWVLEASQTSYNHARSRSTESIEVWDIKIVVDEFRKSERMLLVRERGVGRGWVLTGGGGENGGDWSNGRVIGVRKPFWEVDVEGELWVVGVEWRSLGKG